MKNSILLSSDDNTLGEILRNNLECGKANSDWTEDQRNAVVIEALRLIRKDDGLWDAVDNAVDNAICNVFPDDDDEEADNNE